MTEPQTERTENAEVLQIKAQHQMARMEHEQAMALFDERSIARMPLALRLMFDDRLRERVQRAAEEMSRAVGFTPQHLIGKTEACLVVVTRAITWNLDPYSVAMSTYQTPGGKVGYEGALVRAILEASGELRGAIRHHYYGEWEKLPRPSFVMKKGESGKQYAAPAWEYWSSIEVGLGVTISATLAATGEEMSLDFDLVDAHPRNATTWPTRPKLQLLNPAIRTFARQVRPSLLMGVHLRDDFSDAPEMREINPASAPAPQAQRSALSVIADLNAPSRAAPPPPREPIPQTAPGRGMPLGTNQQVTVPPQDAGYSEAPHQSEWHALAAELAAAPAAERPKSAPPTENAPDWQQSARPFEVVISGERYVKPEEAALALTLLIESGDYPGKILDRYADAIQALPAKLANEVLAAAAARGNKDERKHAAAEQAAAQEGHSRRGRPPGSKNRPKERPPEPAGGDRSQEPTATPAPGRNEYRVELIGDHPDEMDPRESAPEWVTDDGEVVEMPEPAPATATYYLTDTRGDVSATNLTAAAFLGLLESSIGMATSQEAKAWKARNNAALDHLIQNERDEALAERAVKLQA